MTELIPKQPLVFIKPLTDEEMERGLEAIKRAKTLRECILARRRGKPLPSSWRLIRQQREKRSRRL